MYILDEAAKRSLEDCDDLVLNISKGYIFLDNWNYEQECVEEIAMIKYTEDNLSLLKEDLKGFEYREEIIEEE